MDVAEIRKLIRLMEEAGLTELEIEDRSGKVRLVRGAASRAKAGATAGGEGGVEEPSPGWRDGAVRGSLDADATAAGDDDEGIERIPPGMSAISSPMVGTFYRSPSPDAAPFVNPGDTVHAGQVVCIIEAMKMMNEVTAEAAGRIVSVQVENGAAVEYGSPLFLLELAE